MNDKATVTPMCAPKTPDKKRTIKKGDHHRILYLENGPGIYQIDFQNYMHDARRIIFLNPNQYFAQLKGTFGVQEITIPAQLFPIDPTQDKNLRLLFSHIYEVGGIQPADSFANSHPAVSETMLRVLLKQAAQSWKEEKPLHPQITSKELDILFDLRSHIESHYKEHRRVSDYGDWLKLSPKRINQITSSRINLAIGDLINKRLLTEAKRELFFTSKSAKEIAYDLGFSDPAYFNRYFSKQTKHTPSTFRSCYSSERLDPFLEEVLHFIDLHYDQQLAVAFYADKMFMTPKALSAKIKQLTGYPLSRLIRTRIVRAAKEQLIHTNATITDIAFALNFEEASHFSQFFKSETGIAPSAFRFRN